MNFVPSSRPFIGIALAALVAMTGLGVTALPALAVVDNGQLWVFFKIVDRVKEGQKLDVQIPLETLAEVGMLRIWDMKHERVIGQIDGQQLLRTHDQLPINKEVKVATVRDADFDMAVVVVCKEQGRGPGASRVKVERRDWVKDEIRDWVYGPEELDIIMQSFFEGEWKTNPRLKDRVEGIDKLRLYLQRVWEVPGFIFLKMEGGDVRIVVSTD